MPARNVTRCPAKSAVDLDLIDELNVVGWIPLLPGSQFQSFAAMRHVWDRHGDRILDHYVRQRPGTRPFALWALGELPIPPLAHEPGAGAMSTTIEGIVFYSPWHYFGTCTGDNGYYHAGEAWGEFQYLRRLGVVTNQEAALAREWIDDRLDDPTRHQRHYNPLALLHT